MPPKSAQHDRPARPTLAGRLAEDLRAQILSGHLAPNERLNLGQLRETMGVSTSSMREAVARLVSEGLVEVEEQRGYRVMPVSLSNLEEITRLRMVLEPMALRSAMENGGLEWETEVMAALYRLNHTSRNAADPGSVAGWEAAHNTFHQTLVARCDMPVLMHTLRRLMAMNDRYRHIFLSAGAAQRDVAAEHSELAEAATRRDTERAAHLLAHHIETTGTALRDRLADHLPRSLT